MSLIIPTHDNREFISRLLISINNSRFLHFDRIEVIVIDDASTDETIMALKNLSTKLKFTLVLSKLYKHSGPATARNRGAEKARGDYLLFLDSDVVLKPYSLNNAFALVQKNRVKAFTGIWDWRQNTSDFFPQFKALRDWSYWFIEREKNKRYYLFSTRVAGIEKKLFDNLGGFDETFAEPTVEDIELTYRIETHEKIRFCPDIMVKHQFEGFAPIAVKYFKRSRDWIRLFVKRRRFDPVATSRREALKPVSLAVFLFLGSIFLVTGNHFFIYPTLASLLIFSLAELKFFRFIYHKKGFYFLVKSIFVTIVLYLVIAAGTLTGILSKPVNPKNSR